jgi:hypothetical protein
MSQYFGYKFGRKCLSGVRHRESRTARSRGLGGKGTCAVIEASAPATPVTAVTGSETRPTFLKTETL